MQICLDSSYILHTEHAGVSLSLVLILWPPGIALQLVVEYNAGIGDAYVYVQSQLHCVSWMI